MNTVSAATPIPGVHLDEDRQRVLKHYRMVRDSSCRLAEPLSAEDQQIQSMPDASPTKWHLAHTTWFFETFVLEASREELFDERYGYLFNSYYEAIGARVDRSQRGLISRPGVAEVRAYRKNVDRRIEHLILTSDYGRWLHIVPLLELGLQHEQQHQELVLMDIKHVLSMNPQRPAYSDRATVNAVVSTDVARWVAFEPRLAKIGAEERGFAFDNERPRHKVWVDGFALQDRLVTAGEWLDFMADGGYRRPELWLSDGWSVVNQECWRAPLYWNETDAGWDVFTLTGNRMLEREEPVCHVSFYEADAYARWCDKRLPTEAEWEIAAASVSHASSAGGLHPRPAPHSPGLRQLFGELWQWTASPYIAYPRFRTARGAIGEYNGKFMSGQMVLRGSACVTPSDHSRSTYRNFFPPGARWLFSGVRLADDK